MSKNRTSRFIPIIIAVSIVAGILIGTFYANHFSGNRLGIINTSSNKLNALLRIIDDQYVDTVKMNELVEDAMPQILGELDPHSSYIPAKDLEAVNSDLKGSFSGIGIQFTIQQDTIHISNVIQGGPSEKVGLMAGDRIISVNDTAFVGKIVTNYESMKRLKGPKGSEVKLGVYRPGEKEPLYFTIIRGDIPVKSVDTAYMLNEKFGYIKINKFGETTYPELLIALAKLNQDNCKGVIIDLRGNTGGYMGAAIQMVNEFLPKNNLIVYTQGRKSPRENYHSNGTGSSQKMPLIVLTDEGSASASEIFTGAIQDNDRGTVVGRRSFGKGLVQEQRLLPDNSALRLTVARYYVPSGRSIQKPYDEGKEKYYTDIYQRLLHGEFSQKDSIHFDEKLKFQTVGGRTVYGGGGIMPDLFVPGDTVGFSRYLVEVNRKNQYLYDFTFDFMDRHRQETKNIKDYKQLLKYLDRFDLVNEMADYAAARGLKRDEKGIRDSYDVLDSLIKAFIGRHVLDDDGFYPIFYQNDVTIKKAIEAQGTGVQAD